MQQDTYDPKAIANFFIDAAHREKKDVTPLQIIKLVYIAHGWHLAIMGQPLINEPPEAWKYGPVIPSLYHELKIYGNGPVASRITSMLDFNITNLTWKIGEIPPPSDETVLALLQSVWDAYKHLSGGQLSTLTHQEGTPWRQTWDKEGAKYSKGVDIPEDLIMEHYAKLKDTDVRNSA